jgi:hypothetical protein
MNIFSGVARKFMNNLICLKNLYVVHFLLRIASNNLEIFNLLHLYLPLFWISNYINESLIFQNCVCCYYN